MFRALHSGWVVVILLFFNAGSGICQNQSASTPELKTQAKQEFDNGNFSSAYEAYNILLKRYPRDGLFHYYAGISLLEQHKNLPVAIEYLEYASTKSMVPTDVLYYLGKAYRENYQFTESLGVFRKYAESADKAGIRTLDPAHQSEMSGNAIEFTHNYNPFEVYETSLFSFSDSNYVRQIKNKGGNLTVKPEELFTKNEEKGDLTNYYFKPRNLNKGDYVYYSGYGRSKKKGADIFRVKRTLRNGWSEPEAVTMVNTDYDEIMPYYDPVSSDLYFASNGHKSIGGFDVFKSHYDKDRDNWSEPISMGFPVNSPDNEYLVMPGPDLGTLLLITDRQGLDSMLLVYILQMKEPKKSLANASPDVIRQIGELGGIEAISSIIDMRTEAVDLSPVPTDKAVAAAEPAVNKSLNLPDQYQSNVKKALRYQVSADSLSRLAREARINVKEMPDPNERWAWQRKIIAWEKESGDYQEKADQIYAQVKQMEQGQSSQAVPPAIQKDTVMNDITLYTYREAEKKPVSPAKMQVKEEKSPDTGDTFRTDAEPGDKVTPPKNADQSLNHFVILSKSPYSGSNPFPLNTEIPKGSFYRVQLGVFSSSIGFDTFGGITPVTAETVPGKSLTRFFAGKFSHYEDARKALEKIKQAGYKDAFIVSWYDGQKTPVSRVLELEKRDAAR